MLAAFGVDDPGIVPGCSFVTSRYNLDLGLDVGCLWGGLSWDCPRMSLRYNLDLGLNQPKEELRRSLVVPRYTLVLLGHGTIMLAAFVGRPSWDCPRMSLCDILGTTWDWMLAAFKGRIEEVPCCLTCDRAMDILSTTLTFFGNPGH